MAEGVTQCSCGKTDHLIEEKSCCKSAKMNETLLKRIKSQLNAKFYVMNDAWLRDCIEFFIRGKTPQEITDRHIFKFVEGQWQLSNLREINNENGYLPRNLVQQLHTVLTGTYILQVDKMYDIANPKYKQLRAIRKISNDNLEITEKEKSAEWEPRARRMMQLYLTDGVQSVTAIEYIPLKQMTEALLPGYKIMITGPLDCRRGVILLEDGKYREIGGEVESLLKSNALENILARTLDEPENPDPYHDNGPGIRYQNDQNMRLNSTSEDNFFDDDFEQAVDFEAVTAIERQSHQVAETVQDCLISTRKQRQVTRIARIETKEVAVEFLEDIDFEPLENWSSDIPMKPLRVLPASRMETNEFEEENDIMIIEESSTSACDTQGKPPRPAGSIKSENVAKFPDDDFDFDNCEIMIKREESQSQQGENPSKLKSETRTCISPQMANPTNNDLPMEIEKDSASTSKIVQQMSGAKTNFNFRAPPPPLSKICDVLSDVLRKTITGTVYRIVRGQVKNHSALTKQGKCWAVTAIIADHTSSIEVCFDSEILVRYLGFTVQEFSQKKKLAKSDPQVNNELRLSLRKAQHHIENLDALLKLELTDARTPKVVDITQLTPLQKEQLTKRSA